MMRTRRHPTILVLAGLGLILSSLQTVSAGDAEAAAEAPATEAAPEQFAAPASADAPVSKALQALNSPVTLEQENATLRGILKFSADKGVQYIVDIELIEDYDAELAVRVVDIPLREVLQIAARASGLQLEISDSGLVTLVPDKDQPQRRQNNQRERFFDRLREMRERGGMMGGRPPFNHERPDRERDHDDEAPGKKPDAKNRNDGADDKGEGVF